LVGAFAGKALPTSISRIISFIACYRFLLLTSMPLLMESAITNGLPLCY
jgi:hypothetical protein